MKYIYEFYLGCGISPAMVTAVVHALIGTIIIFGAIMIHRVVMISREMKEFPSSGLFEEHWNASVDGVIRNHQIKYPVALIAATYVALLLVNYFISIR